MKIAIISDTHNVLRDEVKEHIADSDEVIHAGDFCSQKIIDEIKYIMKPNAQLYGVQGNNDKEWAVELPKSLTFEINELKFYLTHDKKDIPKEICADIIIFGHSHKYFQEKINNQLRINPGSCGRRRFNLPLTMAMLNIRSSNNYYIEKIKFNV